MMQRGALAVRRFIGHTDAAPPGVVVDGGAGGVRRKDPRYANRDRAGTDAG